MKLATSVTERLSEHVANGSLNLQHALQVCSIFSPAMASKLVKPDGDSWWSEFLDFTANQKRLPTLASQTGVVSVNTLKKNMIDFVDGVTPCDHGDEAYFRLPLIRFLPALTHSSMTRFQRTNFLKVVMSFGAGLTASGFADLLLKVNCSGAVALCIRYLADRGVLQFERSILEKSFKLFEDASFKSRTIPDLSGGFIDLDQYTLCMTRNLLRGQGRTGYKSDIEEELHVHSVERLLEWEDFNGDRSSEKFLAVSQLELEQWFNSVDGLRRIQPNDLESHIKLWPVWLSKHGSDTGFQAKAYDDDGELKKTDSEKGIGFVQRGNHELLHLQDNEKPGDIIVSHEKNELQEPSSDIFQQYEMWCMGYDALWSFAGMVS